MADHITADTSVWVGHFKAKGKTEFAELLATRRVYLHTLVYGELVLGGVSRFISVNSQKYRLFLYIPPFIPTNAHAHTRNAASRAGI